MLLVHFSFVDPNLSALLDCVFGHFELMQSDHYMIASGVGPIMVNELMNEYHIEVINLAGKGIDETATAALLEFLKALTIKCDNASMTLAQMTPDQGNLDGWLAVLGTDSSSQEAQAAVDVIDSKA